VNRLQGYRTVNSNLIIQYATINSLLLGRTTLIN